MVRRVVVTGIGMVNPLGSDLQTVWGNIKEGMSGVGYNSVFDASKFPTKICAEVKDWCISCIGEDPEEWVDRGRHTRFGAGAAAQAISDSGILDANIDPTRFGIYLGSGEGFQEFEAFTRSVVGGLTEEGLDIDAFTARGYTSFNPTRELENEPNLPAAHISAMFDIQGPSTNTLTACAASNQAVGEASAQITRGDVDVMIAGGTHSMIHPFGVTGFNLLTALSTNNDDPTGASRPFDRLRDGFVLG